MGTHTSAQRPVALFVNPRSRRGGRLHRRARRLLAGAGVELGLAVAVADPAELPGRVAAGYDRIIVGADDGTLAAVLPALVHRPVTLGVLPLGTSNSLARALGIPTDSGRRSPSSPGRGSSTSTWAARMAAISSTR